MRRKNKETEFVSVMGLEQPVKSTPVKVKKEWNLKSWFASLWAAVKKNWRAVVTVTVVLVLFIGVFVGGGFYFEHQYQQQLQEEHNKAAKEGMTYFLADATEPEKSEKELTSIITEAYYTNDGSLAVQLCFANGMKKAQYLDSVEVSIQNEDKQVIAAGFSDAIRDDYTIEANGTSELLLYIQPEYVKIADDALDTISYDITTKYHEAE